MLHLERPLNGRLTNGRLAERFRQGGCRRWMAGVGGAVVLVVAATVPAAAANESGAQTITFKVDGGETREVTGDVLLRAADGGVLLLGDDGQLWTVQPETVVNRRSNPEPMEPADRAEMRRRLLAEMPDGFRIHQTANYLICHNTTDRYVNWVGSLFEQLHRGFYAYWKNRGCQLSPPQFPLVALVFADRESFERYAAPEAGAALGSIIGYYNLQTNRITTYNVPHAERQVATIIHEATHQLAYNSGLQTRMVDNPYWVSEGLATFFESPDFSTARGWRNIGIVNQVNLKRFADYAPRRRADSLSTLLADDQRFLDPSTANVAYAEAWALNYFLLRTRADQYVQYLERLREGDLLAKPDPRARLQMVREFFGDLEKLDRDFMLYMQRQLSRR